MKRIPLTQGKFAIVDDDMFDYLNQWKWHITRNHSNIFYARRNVKVNNEWTGILMHRQILNLEPSDKRRTDHENHNGFDNRRCNIRICTQSQNIANSRPHKGTSQYKGVCWFKRVKKWTAYIKCNNKKIHLGYFNNEIDAAKAYDIKAKELFGEFANTNF